MGCGTLLAPYGAFREKSGRVEEVVSAVKSSLEALPSLKSVCEEWKTKFNGAGTVEGVSIAMDTVRRLIASEVMSRTQSDDVP